MERAQESKKVKQNGRRLEEPRPLHIFISRLRFSHHWLFNEEQVMEERVRASWRNYVEAAGRVDDDVHWRQMAALYDAYDDALHLLDKLEHNDADVQFLSLQHQRIDKYRYQRSCGILDAILPDPKCDPVGSLKHYWIYDS